MEPARDGFRVEAELALRARAGDDRESLDAGRAVFVLAERGGRLVIERLEWP